MENYAASDARIISRPFRGLDDFANVRQFLMDTYALNRTYHNWEIRRWEGQWYWGDDESTQKWGRHVQVWETESGQLVGVAHSERSSLGDAWLQIHPDFRHLEDEMLDWSEAHLAVPNDAGKKQLDVEVYEYDTQREVMLAQRGYQKLPVYGVIRWRHLDTPIPESCYPDSYVIRSMRPGDFGDTAHWAEASAIVFSHEIWPEKMRRFQTSPSYRDDLHIIAEAPDGTFAAFAGLTVENQNHTAVFEPVGTHPNHRRKGLARAVMCEGLRRLKPLSVKTVYVGTGDMIPANGLYEAMGFHDYYKAHTWRKAF